MLVTCVKFVVIISLYLLRQRLLNKRIRLGHIVITLVLVLYTKAL